MRRLTICLAAVALLAAGCGNGTEDELEDAAPTEAIGDYDVNDQPETAAAVFVSPSDGDTVTSPFTVKLAAEGVTITPAGEPAVGEAHFHIMVDVGCVDHSAVIPGPSDQATAEGYLHMGDGSDTRQIELEPGTYELCAQLGDGIHQGFGQTDTITVTVE